jgi:hypothetical protein
MMPLLAILGAWVLALFLEMIVVKFLWPALAVLLIFQDPELAKAVAMCYALYSCVQAKLIEVRAMSDCSNLIEKIKDRDRDRPASSVVISDIRKM